MLQLSKYTPPTFPYYTAVPADHTDQYARQQGLSIEFNRESWTLSQDQCDAAFHPLWKPLYDSKACSESRGGRTLHQQRDVEKEAAARELTCVKIINNTLYITDFYHSNGGSRTEAGISLLERSVVTGPEKLPDVRFCLSTQGE